MGKEARSNKKRQRVSSWKPALLPFKTDYNDQFETPEIAYRDILPIIDFLNEKRDSHRLYDPFYCNGRTAALLNGLGFSHVIHECRDFYRDVENDTVPKHDTLVTNPPYSDDHKERCLSFAFQQLRTKGRSFFILMPNYVAAKDYYRRLLLAHPQAGVVYVLPSESYEYDHPEGTGHAVSPFDSIWYCGIGASAVENATKCWNKCRAGDANARDSPRLVTSLDELERLKAIPTTRRRNPRQRKKRRKEMESASSNIGDGMAASSVHVANNTNGALKGKNHKKSRYRNDKGERKRRRF